ncbi:MAG TPA: prepilin-type cleavage/methylation domain-containing protein [Usitatibacter sp.]|nr:prepilin-type cleavage/methylation domain-containing protein [Usitatibacter sp.]
MRTNLARRVMRGAQEGVMLLEALVAILIFSVGVVAVMGMQAVSIEQVTQSKYRMDASYLANQIVGKMWTDLPNLSTYASAGSAGRVAWDATVASTLPNGTATITVAGTLVTVTVNWQMPNETVQRKYVSVVNINAS